MKKLALLVMTLFALASCSSDDNYDFAKETKTQKVDLTIASNSFKVSDSPLRSSAIPSSYLLQYVFYKETGEVFLNKVLYSEELTEQLVGGKASLSFDLPEGKYHVAILSTPYDIYNAEGYIINPVNYETDYYQRKNQLLYGLHSWTYNFESYYETFDLVVDNNVKTQNIELKPMWSMIEFTVENPKTFTVPVGTESIHAYLEDYYDGFYIKSKLSRKTTPPTILPLYFEVLVSIRKQEKITYTLPTTATEDKEIKLQISYMKNDGTITLGTKDIITFETQSGKNYSISGKLENAGESQSMNITLGELDESIIEIPY